MATIEGRHQSFGFSFPSVVYQLRTAQVVALFLEVCILYMEYDRIGLYFLIPLAVHLLNIYHTGSRLYYNIDGRYDLKQMLAVKDTNIKAKYAFEIDDLFLDEYKVRYSQDKVALVEKDAYIMDGIFNNFKTFSAVFGSVVLALIGHLIVGSIPSTLNALIYTLSDYASLVAASGVLLAEVYETYKPSSE
uniref:ABC transmembrane type-1 domain-containing protein n=1 Tax=Ascaris lumbricoides TaxID=6252 RepID=A0A0M3HZA8_ASCLU